MDWMEVVIITKFANKLLNNWWSMEIKQNNEKNSINQNKDKKFITKQKLNSE